MRHQEFEPPVELQDTIKCFWYTSVDFEKQTPGFDVLPDGYAEIIFLFGGNCSVSSNGALQLLPSPFVMGLLNQPIHLFTQNRLEIIAIRCFPWTVFDLLGLPPGKDGLRLFEHPLSRLHPTIKNHVDAGSINLAIEEVKQFFLHLNPGIANNTLLNRAGVAMLQGNGNLPVSQVAAAAHATVRTLERQFRQCSGYSVKEVSGLMRFEQVRNHLLLNPKVNLAGLALELGYTDQSHLSREFKRYSGSTPAAFARKIKV